jgi:hypothetical protein
MCQIIRPSKDSNNSNKKTVIVLGAPRGGTSVVAGILRCLGIYMGENLGHQHEDPIFKRKVPEEEKIKTITERNKKYDIWGWKMPDTVHYIEQVISYTINPHFIAVYRNPLEIAESSAKYDGRELSTNLLNVPINHYKKMHNFMKNDDNPLLVCSLPNIQGKPKSCAKNMADFLGVKIDTNQLNLVEDFVLRKGGYKKLKL